MPTLKTPAARAYNRKYLREYRLDPENRKRLREYMRRYLADPVNRARRDEKARALRFGITVERLREVLAPGRCAICGATSPGGKYDWHIDHDHATGEVREMLCHGCNIGIGAMGDDPQRVRAAAEYLEKHLRLRSVA